MNTTLRAIALSLLTLAAPGYSQEPEKPTPEKPGGTLPATREITDSQGRLVGDWSCNGNEKDIYTLRKDGTAVHGNDRATWTVVDGTLELKWNNGYRTVFPVTADTTLSGKSYPVNKTNAPDNVTFEKINYFPAIREITDSTGRKMQVTILSKTAESVKIRRTSDGKEFDFALDKLSEEDQQFVASAKAKKPKALMFLQMEYHKDIQTQLADAGYDWEQVTWTLDKTGEYHKLIWDISGIDEAKLAEYDILFYGEGLGRGSEREEHEKWKGLMQTYKGVMVVRVFSNISAKRWLTGRGPEPQQMTKFVETNDNIVFYNNRIKKATGGANQPFEEISFENAHSLALETAIKLQQHRN